MSMSPNAQRNDARSAESTTREMIASTKDASENFVRENPVTATLIATGAGALVGLLIAQALGRSEAEVKKNYFARIGNQIAGSIGQAIPDSLNWRR